MSANRATVEVEVRGFLPSAPLWLALAVALHCGLASAQSQLTPCDEYVRSPYYDGVERIISGAVPQPSLLHLATLPSFENESGLRLVGAEVYFVQFLSFYWGDAMVYDSKGVGRMNFARPRISTRVSHAPLSEPIARRVDKVYAKAITRAKRAQQPGVDGVSYVFATADGACAAAWSPQDDTRNARLVQLLKLLEKHAQRHDSEAAIVRMLQMLEKE